MVAVLNVKEMAGRCPQPKARPSIPRRQVEPGYIGQDFLKNYLSSVKCAAKHAFVGHAG